MVEEVGSHAAIGSITLTGSRARGEAGPLSDWDFEVETGDFAAVVGALRELVAPLEPLAQQWDRLSEHACYMLMLPGAVKVDLIFEEPHSPEPRWVVSRETLRGVDELGAGDAPVSIELAIDAYLPALRRAEERLGVRVPDALQREVMARLREHGYAF